MVRVCALPAVPLGVHRRGALHPTGREFTPAQPEAGDRALAGSVSQDLGWKASATANSGQEYAAAWGAVGD